MMKIQLAARLWFLTSVNFGIAWLLYALVTPHFPAWTALLATVIALIGSLPVFVILLLTLPWINRNSNHSVSQKKERLLSVCFVIGCLYGTGIGILISLASSTNVVLSIVATMLVMVACIILAFRLSVHQLSQFFSPHQITINKSIMESNTYVPEPAPQPSRSNRIFVKGLITAGLILALLIPTIFINNLVDERRKRQAQVSNEVNNKWAQAQTLIGPYMYLPYKVVTVHPDKTITQSINHITIIPDDLSVTGNVSHELRKRSIYKVLLYKASINNSGKFRFTIPKEVDSSMIQWQNAKICYGLSDFKGIEERLKITFNGESYELSPGLPSNDISMKGLSAAIPLTTDNIDKDIPFQMNVKIKGSERLHFIPLSGDSKFNLQSTWSNPSFDGNNLPSIRTVTDNGFNATWTFNKANLPFGTVLNDFKFDEESLAFGVTLIQPADGYAKTERCIKYAILFIGLTFSLFFIIELMQKKAVHPVQYILIGMALIIFYTLLLSISEFLAFDIAYAIAAGATILLVSLYAYGHFRSVKTALIFSTVLTMLYGFTFVLIRLEDTALLIGSIGLFIILAIAMYFSRKINWYGAEASVAAV